MQCPPLPDHSSSCSRTLPFASVYHHMGEPVCSSSVYPKQGKAPVHPIGRGGLSTLRCFSPSPVAASTARPCRERRLLCWPQPWSCKTGEGAPQIPCQRGLLLLLLCLPHWGAASARGSFEPSCHTVSGKWQQGGTGSLYVCATILLLAAFTRGPWLASCSDSSTVSGRSKVGRVGCRGTILPCSM